jgi:hypothetical protein
VVNGVRISSNRTGHMQPSQVSQLDGARIVQLQSTLSGDAQQNLFLPGGTELVFKRQRHST